MLSHIVLSSCFPNSWRRCPHIISSLVVVSSSHFRSSGAAVELHHGGSEHAKLGDKKCYKRSRSVLYILSHTLALAVYAVLPPASLASYASSYLLDNQSSCLHVVSLHFRTYSYLRPSKLYNPRLILHPLHFRLGTPHLML